MNIYDSWVPDFNIFPELGFMFLVFDVRRIFGCEAKLQWDTDF